VNLALFDLEPVGFEYVFDPPLRMQVDIADWTDAHRSEWKAWHAALRCAGPCRRLLRNAPTSHACGGARSEGSFSLCDDCAAIDYNSEGRSRWGIRPCTKCGSVDAGRCICYRHMEKFGVTHTCAKCNREPLEWCDACKKHQPLGSEHESHGAP
jgi:hypothetical protein